MESCRGFREVNEICLKEFGDPVYQGGRVLFKRVLGESLKVEIFYTGSCV